MIACTLFLPIFTAAKDEKYFSKASVQTEISVPLSAENFCEKQMKQANNWQSMIDVVERLLVEYLGSNKFLNICIGTYLSTC